MMTVTISDKTTSIGNGGSSFANMAVWEAGYNICLEISRTADSTGDRDATAVAQLKNTATAMILDISKAAAFRPGRKYLRFLKGAFVNTRQLTTLLMLCHDLNYISTDRYLDLNSKINVFSSKLWKFMKYTERRLRKIKAK